MIIIITSLSDVHGGPLWSCMLLVSPHQHKEGEGLVMLVELFLTNRHSIQIIFSVFSCDLVTLKSIHDGPWCCMRAHLVHARHLFS